MSSRSVRLGGLSGTATPERFASAPHRLTGITGAVPFGIRLADQGAGHGGRFDEGRDCSVDALPVPAVERVSLGGHAEAVSELLGGDVGLDARGEYAECSR
jgi:hypothetical protein